MKRTRKKRIGEMRRRLSSFPLSMHKSLGKRGREGVKQENRGRKIPPPHPRMHVHTRGNGRGKERVRKGEKRNVMTTGKLMRDINPSCERERGNGKSGEWHGRERER